MQFTELLNMMIPIDEIVIEIAEEMQEDRSNEIHVTDLVGCIRASYFKKIYGARFNLTQAISVILGLGLHELFIPFLAGKLNGEYEVEMEYEGIKGKADIVTDEYVVEVKTVNNIPYKPYKSHLEQLNFYMQVLNKSKGLLLYIGKISHVTKLYEFFGDKDMFLKTLEKGKELKEALEKRKPPKCNLSLVEQRIYCKNCMYRRECNYES